MFRPSVPLLIFCLVGLFSTDEGVEVSCCDGIQFSFQFYQFLPHILVLCLDAYTFRIVIFPGELTFLSLSDVSLYL